MNNVFRKIVLIEKTGRYDYERLNFLRYMIEYCERNRNVYGHEKFKNMFKVKMRKLIMEKVKKNLNIK
jgi:hypothetical protein